VVIKKMGVNKKFVPLYKEVVENENVDSSQSHVADDVQPVQAEDVGAGTLPVSDDVQKTQEETSETKPSSLNGSQSTESEKVVKEEAGSASDSSENGQSATAAQDGSVSGATEEVGAPVEVKIEASEVPAMQDEPAATIEEVKEKTKIGDENASK
jgi:hypothetical protein